MPTNWQYSNFNSFKMINELIQEYGKLIANPDSTPVQIFAAGVILGAVIVMIAVTVH